jgi:hypothetical protein
MELARLVSSRKRLSLLFAFPSSSPFAPFSRKPSLMTRNDTVDVPSRRISFAFFYSFGRRIVMCPSPLMILSDRLHICSLIIKRPRFDQSRGERQRRERNKLTFSRAIQGAFLQCFQFVNRCSCSSAAGSLAKRKCFREPLESSFDSLLIVARSTSRGS